MSAPLPPWDGTQVCAQADPEQFFPDKGASSVRAKDFCAVCPLESACLEYALELEHGTLGHGIWGGKSAAERRAIARARAAKRRRDDQGSVAA